MRRTGKLMTGILIGGIMGFAVGTLFAPDSGDETRKRIRQGAHRLLDEVRMEADEIADQLRQRAEQVADQTRALVDRSSGIMQEMGRKLEQANEKLGELHKRSDDVRS